MTIREARAPLPTTGLSESDYRNRLDLIERALRWHFCWSLERTDSATDWLIQGAEDEGMKR